MLALFAESAVILTLLAGLIRPGGGHGDGHGGWLVCGVVIDGSIDG